MGIGAPCASQEKYSAPEGRGFQDSRIGPLKQPCTGAWRGLIKGRADTLRGQLERRFGPLPQEVRARIDAASLAELDRWLDAVLDAASLDAVLGSDQA